MISYFTCFFLFLSSFFRFRCNLGPEVIALCLQPSVLQRKQFRPRLRLAASALACMEQRPGHRLASSWLPLILAPSIAHKSSREAQSHAGLRSAIRQMTEENATWGAASTHGELLKLGFDVSGRTVSRYLRRLSPSDQASKLWATFLCNREVIAAMDFFTVLTITFRILCCFFVIGHGRRRVLLFNATEPRNSSWERN
jgi:hypothetical protein